MKPNPNPIKELTEIRQKQQERPILIALARLQGTPWKQITKATGLSRQGATNLYKQALTDVHLLDTNSSPPNKKQP